MAAFRIVLTRPRLSQAKFNARRARRFLRYPGYSIRKISARKMHFLSATAGKRLRKLHKRLHRTEVPDRFFTHCPIEWKALEQSFDWYLEFFPIQGVRNLGNCEYFVWNVPRR